MSGPYQEAKALLKSYLQQHGYGSWIVKSPCIEQFSMWIRQHIVILKSSIFDVFDW